MKVMFIVIALVVAVIAAICVRASMIRKRVKRRMEFYRKYDPPKGRAAVADRKDIERTLLKKEGMNRNQRRAMAKEVQRIMAARAKEAKAL